jgi:hypothetical protein
MVNVRVDKNENFSLDLNQRAHNDLETLTYSGNWPLWFKTKPNNCLVYTASAIRTLSGQYLFTDVGPNNFGNLMDGWI